MSLPAVLLASANILAVANVPDAETEFHAHEFLDATIQPRPIWISPNEVYSMHRLLSQYLTQLVRLWDIITDMVADGEVPGIYQG